MRINKFLSHAGIASRRKCDLLIASKKVKINGKIVTNFSYKVIDGDIIECNGQVIESIPKKKVFLLNKLKGYVSTSFDPQGRKCVIDLVPSEDRLFTVGRLDRDTTGAILLTNDGELANKLMHPKNKIIRMYIVATKIDIPKKIYTKLSSGLKLDDGYVSYGDLERLGRENGLIIWKITLRSGKNHEVKRIFKTLGSQVIHLHRYSFAGMDVENIKPGKFKMLKDEEIKLLKNQL